MSRQALTSAVADARSRCPWAGTTPLMCDYHDREWGVPQHDDRVLFEFLILEGAQAGLSWRTILQRREGYRRAFDDFDAKKIATYTDDDRARLLADAGIIRNRLKIDAAIGNARAYLALCEAHGSLDAWLWKHVDGAPLIQRRQSAADVPVRTELSDRISKALLALGFKFVGSTIIYAYLQATGVVNDHLLNCFRHAEIGGRD